MKITIVNPSTTFSSTGGGSVHEKEVISHLLQAGNQISVISAKPSEHNDIRRFSVTPFEVFKAIKWADVLYMRFRATDLYPGHFSRAFKLSRKILRRPLIWEINSPVEEGLILNDYDQKECDIRVARARKAAKQVSAAICVSKEMQRYAKTTLKIPKTVYAPNGGNCSNFAPSFVDKPLSPESTDKVNVLWMGSGSLPWEGHRISLQIAKKIQVSNPQIQFTFVGGGNDEGFENIENVRHLGKIEHTEIPKILSSADICLCLYDIAAFGNVPFYNSPLKLYEYMAAGKAIVATHAGEISRAIDHNSNGILVGSDIPNIAAEIIKLAQSPKLRNRLGAKARESAEHYFNWKRVAEVTEATMHSALNS